MSDLVKTVKSELVHKRMNNGSSMLLKANLIKLGRIDLLTHPSPDITDPVHLDCPP